MIKAAGKVADGEARAHIEVLAKKYGVKMNALKLVLRADAFAVVVTAVPWDVPRTVNRPSKAVGTAFTHPQPRE